MYVVAFPGLDANQSADLCHWQVLYPHLSTSSNPKGVFVKGSIDLSSVTSTNTLPDPYKQTALIAEVHAQNSVHKNN